MIVRDNVFLGEYSLDLQGVRPPLELLLIEKGILKSVMSNRVPTVGSFVSTGSMRGGILEAGIPVSLAPGILLIDGSSSGSGVSSKALKRELLETCKKARE